jgi:hypothetical protein
LQHLAEIVNGQESKIWVIPSELSGAMENLSKAFKKP